MSIYICMYVCVCVTAFGGLGKMARSSLRPPWSRWREREELEAEGARGPGWTAGDQGGDDFRPLEAARFPESRIRECSRIITRALAAAWSSGIRIINPCASRRTISNAYPHPYPRYRTFRWIYRRRAPSFLRRRLENIEVWPRNIPTLFANMEPFSILVSYIGLRFGVEFAFRISTLFFSQIIFDSCTSCIAVKNNFVNKQH